MKKYVKSKSKQSGPNATGPKYRTPDHFKGATFAGGSKFSGRGKAPVTRFDPGKFKIQHKG